MTKPLFRSVHCVAALLVFFIAPAAGAQAPDPGAANPPVPDWAIPGSATHKQGPPPRDFHRQTITVNEPIGIFDGQSDVGAALAPGSASYDATNKTYTINSAGYNIWYSRDEFRFLWKKLSGDVSIAADIAFPDPKGYGDRKAVLVIRQSLEDDARQVVVALHGEGMIQLAQRPEKGELTKDREYRVGGRGRPTGRSPDSLVNDLAKRVGLEKRGNSYQLFVSIDGEPMHAFGPPLDLDIEGPFYVGIGFCAHLPDTVDTAVLSNVVLINKAGKVR
ncbi:MAG: biopolymer transporter Tol [Pseudomonadota bacterium]